jgi:2-oxo-4-hydroxy-4-carboxy-5-ureidoimidazoline decarboxylase
MRWAKKMAAHRPFSSLADCQAQALTIWQRLTEEDYLEAFDGHPKIGNLASLAEKYAATHALASGEQRTVAVADAQTLAALARGNQQYESQNGFIFIVCATGKSASEMLALLEARLTNTRSQELKIAAEEQAKITALRLEKLVRPIAEDTPPGTLSDKPTGKHH